jgi:L-fuconate dehydratase
MPIIIQKITARDIRFPTSLNLDGSDAMNPDPDYSATYVAIKTNNPDLTGYGLTFTIGRGNELCVAAVESIMPLIIGKSMESIIDNMGEFWHLITNDSQLRWIGPDKGVIHLAIAAIVNAVWDLYCKMEKKPLWKLLVDMSHEQLVSCIDFSYITDALTAKEAVEILKQNQKNKNQREREMLDKGYPAYITSVGWLGYSDDKVRQLCRTALADGWSYFKMKVGANCEDDQRRAAIIREEIGYERKLMMDANQRWEVNEAINNMKKLAKFQPWWIEEPTSPDDILGHAKIARAIAPIGVATGEHCQNRIMFKQFLAANAIKFCQIDTCRLGGVNEVLAVLLLAKKFEVAVCLHTGGVGLCEYAQHIALFDYISVSASLENRILEYVDHLHEHFLEPVIIKNGHYLAPKLPGYGANIFAWSLDKYEYPSGSFWRVKNG